MIWNLLLACGVEEKEITHSEGEVIVEDVDGDGYTDSEDCNDEDASIYPDATEICDGIDNNCDGQVDEDVLNEYFADSDEDGFGNPNLTVFACEPDNGFVAT